MAQAPEIHVSGRVRYMRLDDLKSLNEDVWLSAAEFISSCGVDPTPHKLRQHELRQLKEGMRLSKSESPNKSRFIKYVPEPKSVI